MCIRDRYRNGELILTTQDFSYLDDSLEYDKDFQYDIASFDQGGDDGPLVSVKVRTHEEVTSPIMAGAADLKQVTSTQQTVSIYTDGNFSKDELSKLKWIRGKSNVQIIMNNQLLKIPGQFEISSEMISKMKNLNGVKKIDLI